MPTPILNLRLPEDEAAALTELAEARGINRSDLIREVLRATLADNATGAPRP